MITITLPRAVVEQVRQALTVLLDHLDGVPADKVALADWIQAEADLCSALAQQAGPVEEPMAWAYMGIKQDGTEHGPHLVWKPEYMDAMSASKGAKAIPLYTPPPQHKPLTDEEIEDIYLAWDVTPGRRIVGLVRAIERAHGIGEEK